MNVRAWLQGVLLVFVVGLGLQAADARHVVRFVDGQRVAIHGWTFPMNGFRFLGNPTLQPSLTLLTGESMHILVITETIEGRGCCFSGRVTQIRTATSNNVTLVQSGTVGRGDFLLPAPPRLPALRGRPPLRPMPSPIQASCCPSCSPSPST